MGHHYDELDYIYRRIWGELEEAGINFAKYRDCLDATSVKVPEGSKSHP
jgi:hypothetical protein